MVKKWLNIVWIVALLVASVPFLAGCGTIKNKMPWEKLDLKMDDYADARYRKAIIYMKESRFELAQEQFAIVAATANSPELKKLGLAGYSKAYTAIAIKR